MRSSIEAGEIITEGVRYRARKRFREGNLQNPYCGNPLIPGDCSEIRDALKCAMCEVYNDEINRLKKEHICPCCGQSIIGDIDP